MKLFLLLSLFFTSTVLGQTRGKPIEGNYCQGVSCESNLVINPSAEKNALNVTVNNATATRGTGLADGLMINGKGVWIIDASALNGYVQFDLNAPLGDQTSTSLNCAYSGSYNGDASLYSAYLVDGSNNVLVSQQLTNTASTWKEFKLNASCAAAGQRKVRLVQTSAGTAPAFYAGKITYGRSEIAMGSIDEDLGDIGQTIIPQVSGTISNYTVTSKGYRRGKYLKVDGVISFTGTSSPFVGLYLPIPKNWKANSVTNIGPIVGSARWRGTGIGYGDVIISNDTTLVITARIINTHTGEVPVRDLSVTEVMPVPLTSGAQIVFSYELPIQGWTAGARVSDGYDAQVVGAGLYRAGVTQAVSSAAETKITYTNVDTDSTGNTMASLTNNRINILTAGYYNIKISQTFDGSTLVANEVYIIRVKKSDGTQVVGVAQPYVGAAGSLFVSASRDNVYLNAGDYIEAFVQSSGDTNYLLSGSQPNAFLTVQKVSGAAYITPLASVAEHWTGTAGDAVGTSFGIVKFTTKEDSTSGAYNSSTGIFTAPIDGRYSVSWFVSALVNISTSERIVASLYKNGTLYRTGLRSIGVGTSVVHSTGGAVFDVHLKAGETLSIHVVSSVVTTALTQTDACYFSVIRIGP